MAGTEIKSERKKRRVRGRIADVNGCGVVAAH